MLRSAVLLPWVLVVACTSPAPGETDRIVVAPDGKADAAEIKVHAASLTVWMRPVATARDGGWVRARTSKNLAAVSTFIADDGFASARVVSPRVFEVALDGGHELNSMLTGLRLFVDVEVAGSTTPYTLAIELEPRFARFDGSGSIYVFRALRPILAGSDLVYRGRARAEGDLSVTGARVSAREPGLWNVDAQFDELLAEHLFAVGPATKTAEVDVAVAAVGLTTEDPQVVWADSWDYECDPAVAACLNALPPEATDTESCGSYRDVTRCNL
jgi:hypothetical protein